MIDRTGAPPAATERHGGGTPLDDTMAGRDAGEEPLGADGGTDGGADGGAGNDPTTGTGEDPRLA